MILKDENAKKAKEKGPLDADAAATTCFGADAKARAKDQGAGIHTLVQRISSFGYTPSPTLSSIVLVGGKGTRLTESRKIITREHFPMLSEEYIDRVGPKGLAMMKCEISGKQIQKPAADWHLDIHASCPQVKNITLALGCEAEMVMDYYLRQHKNIYAGRPLSFLVEKNPAGTLAPIVKLMETNSLPSTPLVYANGDNLIGVDFYRCYLEGCLSALKAGIDPSEIVIDIVTYVLWEESSLYGAVDIDLASGKISGFREKSEYTKNAYVLVDGKKMTTINAGFSIIVNPRALFAKHLSEDVMRTSRLLEQGKLEYKGNESKVKYETLYATLAKENRLFGVAVGGYWSDLGTEERILAAEQEFGKSSVFR